MDAETRFTLTLFPNRRNPRGKRETYTWPELCEVFRHPEITDETLEEYEAMTNEQKTEVKDVGGYVAGVFRNDRRSKATLENRQILTLDVDHADQKCAASAMLFNVACLIHTTHSSTQENPRYRWLFPLSRPVNSAEYRYLANKMSEWVGAEAVDESTDQPERLMFWPSVSFDGEYYVDCNEDCDFLNPDEHLPEDIPEERVEERKPITSGTLEVGEGQRNRTVFEFAATLRGKGLDENGIREMLEQYNDRYCSPPLESFELDTICRSVCSRYEAGDAVTNLRNAWDDFNDMGEWKEKETKPAGLQIKSFSELLKTYLPPITYFVDELIPPGLTEIVAPPKFGKSWFCLDLAISLATGTDFLGMKTTKCGTLYLALEDGDLRMQDRGRKVQGDREDTEGYYYLTEAPTLDTGLLDMLHELLAQHPEIKVVIIDTFQKIRGTARKNEGAYAHDYREASSLQKFGLAHNIAVVFAHHTNKSGGDGSDFMTKTSGTNGITGAADVVLMLERSKREDKETVLRISGRDVRERSLMLTMDWGTYRWTVLGEERDVTARREELAFERDPFVKTVVHLLDDAQELALPGETSVTVSLTSSELVDEIERLFGASEYNAVSIGRKVNRLAGELEKRYGISYKDGRDRNRRAHIFTRDII